MPDEQPINDAESYGVRVVQVAATSGQLIWRAMRVHHLTPQENGGNHHIYLDILDQAGQRINGAQAHVTWNGGEQTVTIDKPPSEPGTNCPMWRGQVYAVEALGLPSDRVENMHTSHPDEPPGNTLFHHSFLVVFQRMAVGQPAAASVLQGIVHNGAGRAVRLLRSDAEIAQATVGADQRFRFAGLAAGQYTVQVVGANIASAAITLDGQNSVEIELTVPTLLGTIEGWVHRGAGRTVLALKDGATEMARSVVAADESFHLQDLGAGTYVVAVAGTGVFSQPVALLAGASELLELTLPDGGGLPAERPLPHYVLLGPAGAPGERTNFLLAADYIARFQLPFGYSLLDAHQALRVTIIGDGYGPVDVADLVSEGIRVERINGGPDAVRAALAARFTNGQP